MSFDDDEKSRESGQPREFYLITHGATKYTIASGDRDIAYNGDTYVATPSARGQIQISPVTTQANFELQLPSSHLLVQRYLARGGVPPRQITVTVRRQQLTSGEIQQIWVGYVVSMALDGHIAKFAIPSRTSQSLQRKLPILSVDASCGNVLYDAWCTASRASFVVSTTVIGTNGQQVTVNSMGGQPDQWARYGELVHVPSGERMTISDQTAAGVVTLQYPIAELLPGDAVQIFAGCDHTPDPTTGCGKFSNIANYAGLPQRPTANPWITSNLGVESE